jgi:hypothetical protein
MLTLCIADHEPMHLTEEEMRRLALAIKQVAVGQQQDVQFYLRCKSYVQAVQRYVQLDLPLEM